MQKGKYISMKKIDTGTYKAKEAGAALKGDEKQHHSG
jgi:hypothetical protein